MITIKTIKSKTDLREFIDFPHELYRDDTYYVPELYLAQKDLLGKTSNPFFKHSHAEYYLAQKDGKTVGRIAAIVNNNYNSQNNEHIGFFGFFDCVNDIEVSRALFDKAFEYITQHGFRTMVGPENFTMNDSCGIQIGGYDTYPYPMMPHNRPYYKDLLEANGFVKKYDLFSYMMDCDTFPPDKKEKAIVLETKLRDEGITFRTINLKDFKQDIESIRVVYNKSIGEIPGELSMTEEEMLHLFMSLKSILKEDYVHLAEHEGKVIGVVAIIPNLNEITRNFKKGRLFPFNIVTFLSRLKKIRSSRLPVVGILQEYRRKGIYTCFYGKVMDVCKKYQFEQLETSWVAEENENMRKGLEGLNGYPYQTFRIFEKTI